jgi:GT2 family glycosyltransferase
MGPRACGKHGAGMSRVLPVFAEVESPLAVSVVIVLYRMEPAQSPAFRSVMAARKMLGPDLGDVHVLLWDNSPQPGAGRDLQERAHYFPDQSNSGLATAYNRAIEWASQNGSEWLLTLDQDTAVPDDFFAKMALAARASTRYAGIGAIVPQIAAGGKQLSPNYFQFGAIPRWFRKGYVGVPHEPVFAFNSGAMLRLAALRQVGGYDPRFWLDDSDAMIFSKLHEHGKRVYVAGDIQVEHEFSMKDMQKRMSPARYRNALLAETAFWDLRMTRTAGWERTLRLALRLVKHWLRRDSPELRRITWQALKRRLLTSRRRRIEEWLDSTADRVSGRAATRQSTTAPRISACMAAYNGGGFVEAQLHSILSQLNQEDEVVIVDDGSTDDTLLRVMDIGDARVRLLKHEKNAGVAATFEDALRSANGDILFLCDDDDLWAPTKARRFLDVFERRPEAGIAMSRVRMIDEKGQPMQDSRINRHGRFSPGFWRNLFMNHYQGSAMAIRASLLGRVLPFPARKSFLHDAWIGTRNDLMGGKIAFLDEDLLYYRRHGNNASHTKPLVRQIQTRVELLLAHLLYAFRSSTRLFSR